MEDLSDRELERYMAENMAAKWFCGFALNDVTPDHTVFCNFRKRLGTTLLSKIFAQMRDQLKAAGYMSEVFTFVDASHLISKANLWEERDEAIQAKYEKKATALEAQSSRPLEEVSTWRPQEKQHEGKESGLRSLVFNAPRAL